MKMQRDKLEKMKYDQRENFKDQWDFSPRYGVKANYRV